MHMYVWLWLDCLLLHSRLFLARDACILFFHISIKIYAFFFIFTFEQSTDRSLLIVRLICRCRLCRWSFAIGGTTSIVPSHGSWINTSAPDSTEMTWSRVLPVSIEPLYALFSGTRTIDRGRTWRVTTRADLARSSWTTIISRLVFRTISRTEVKWNVAWCDQIESKVAYCFSWIFTNQIEFLICNFFLFSTVTSVK